MTARKEWSVDCRDVAAGSGELTVFASGGHIVLVAPPGETAVLAPLEADDCAPSCVSGGGRYCHPAVTRTGASISY